MFGDNDDIGDNVSTVHGFVFLIVDFVKKLFRGLSKTLSSSSPLSSFDSFSDDPLSCS